MKLQVFVLILAISYGSPAQRIAIGHSGAHYQKLPVGDTLHSACLHGFWFGAFICNLSVSFLSTAGTPPLPGTDTQISPWPLISAAPRPPAVFEGLTEPPKGTVDIPYSLR